MATTIPDPLAGQHQGRSVTAHRNPQGAGGAISPKDAGDAPGQTDHHRDGEAGAAPVGFDRPQPELLPDDIACWFIDTDYDDENFFVRHAYFCGGDQPYEKLQRALKAEIDEGEWQKREARKSWPFGQPGRVASDRRCLSLKRHHRPLLNLANSIWPCWPSGRLGYSLASSPATVSPTRMTTSRINPRQLRSA